MNYLMLIIDGWVQNPDFLPEYFYREFKKAEKEHIGWKEFLTNLENVLKALRVKIDEPYYRDLHLWYQYDAQQRERGEPVDMDKPEKTDNGQPLLFLTNQKYTGHIWGRDVDFIEKSVNEGCEKWLREKGLFPLFFYAMPEKDIMPSEAVLIDPAKLQKVIELSQKINDLSFKKELETKEPEQIKEYLDFHLRCYLRNEGKQDDWIKHTKNLMPVGFSSLQKDAFLTWIEDNLLNIENVTGQDGKPSKLTHLLQLYYEKGCKPLTKPQVEKLATEKNITKTVLVNRWNDLKADNYQHNGNVNNVKEFIKSYQLLMQTLKESNKKAFVDIKNHYDQLKETYPDLAY